MSKIELIEGKLTRSIIGAFSRCTTLLRNGKKLNRRGRKGRGGLQPRELLTKAPAFSSSAPSASSAVKAVAVAFAFAFAFASSATGAPRELLDDKVVVETKSAYDLPKAARRQVLNYLRASRLEVGLLLHFGPEANFYRVVYRQSRMNPRDPVNLRDPRSPFDVEVRTTGSSGGECGA